MTMLSLLNRIIENFQNSSLKEALLEEHIGSKRFYAALKEYPECEQRFKALCKSKRSSIKRGKKRFSEELLSTLREAYQQGESLDSLSKKYKTSPLVIKREFENNGIILRTSKDNAKIQSERRCPVRGDAMWSDIYKVYIKRRGLYKTAKEFHTSAEKLKENFKRLGLPLVDEVRLRSYETLDGLKTWDDEDYWKKVYDYYQCHSISSVSEKYGIERRRLYFLFNLYGWKVRNRKEENAFRLIGKGIESFNRALEQLEEYEIMEEFRGYTNHGKFIPYTFLHKTCGKTFTRTLHDLTNIRCTHCYPKSFNENFISEYLSAYTKVDNNKRDIIPPQELDIFLPEYNVAIEYNGRYWHSELFASKNYHVEKTEECLKRGIKLVHFWEGWNRDIIESRLNQLIGRSNQIYARNTTVEEVLIKQRKDFFEKCHISGDAPSIFAMGLYFEGVLVACMSFRKHKEGLELARFACLLNTSIVGGFSKLFKASLKYIKENYFNIDKIITYCNRDWTADYKDSVYYKNGFTFIKNSGPILCYYNSTSGATESREKYQKHKLKKLFPEYSGENVNEFLKSKRIYRIYNSGNWKFEWRISNENKEC